MTLGEVLVGAYLHGSTAAGRLQPDSDIDVLAIARRPTTTEERVAIVHGLFEFSGRRARRGPARPVELTIVVQDDVRPWRMPPRMDLQYGEWLRDQLERGEIPPPSPTMDLAAILTMVMKANRAILGPPPADVLDPVPAEDLRRAVVAGVPDLLGDLESDTRNVLLTLARVWRTVATGDVVSKDQAAEWASTRLPPDLRATMSLARDAYLGLRPDDWSARQVDARTLADHLVAEIDAASLV